VGSILSQPSGGIGRKYMIFSITLGM